MQLHLDNCQAQTPFHQTPRYQLKHSLAILTELTLGGIGIKTCLCLMFKPQKIGNTCYLCGSERKVNLLFWLLNVFSIGPHLRNLRGRRPRLRSGGLARRDCESP